MLIDAKNLLEEYKIIVIIRKHYGEELLKLAESLYEGGVRMLEVTYDQGDPECCVKTFNAISMLNGEMKDKMLFGAGTVLTKEQVDLAHKAGAAYIISPNTDEEIIKYTKQKGLISMPGAMTPSEIIAAGKYGADYIKVFPAADLGVGYIKSVLSPVNYLKVIAVGGVNEKNIADMLKVGYIGVGIGGYLTDKKLISSGNFAEITNRARNLVNIINGGNI